MMGCGGDLVTQEDIRNDFEPPVKISEQSGVTTIGSAG
jgi:hypothetical protein